MAKTSVSYHPEPGTTVELRRSNGGTRWLDIKSATPSESEITIFVGAGLSRTERIAFARQLRDAATALHVELLEEILPQHTGRGV